MSIYDTPNSSSIIPKFCKCDSSIGSTAAWCCNQCGLPTGKDYTSNDRQLASENERLRGLLKDALYLVPIELANRIHESLSQSTDKQDKP